jgi:hypothetical protein
LKEKDEAHQKERKEKEEKIMEVVKRSSKWCERIQHWHKIFEKNQFTNQIKNWSMQSEYDKEIEALRIERAANREKMNH